MRRAIAIGLCAILPVLPAAAALAAGHDGNWSVLVVTERGACDRAYRYDVTIANGRVRFDGAPGIDVSGTVSPKGLVRVRISGGSGHAEGSGHISGQSGTGIWRGSSGGGDSCAGRWEAARR